MTGTELRSFVLAAINAIGEISIAEAQTAIAREMDAYLEKAEQERDAMRKERDEWERKAKDSYYAREWGRVVNENNLMTAKILERESQLATLTAEGRAEGLREAAEELKCRSGGPHYCPNCGRTLGPDLLRSLAQTQPREEGR